MQYAICVIRIDFVCPFEIKILDMKTTIYK